MSVQFMCISFGSYCNYLCPVADFSKVMATLNSLQRIEERWADDANRGPNGENYLYFLTQEGSGSPTAASIDYAPGAWVEAPKETEEG